MTQPGDNINNLALTRLLRNAPDESALAGALQAPRTVTFRLDASDIAQAERRWITHEYLTRTTRGWLVMIACTGYLFTLLGYLTSMSMPFAVVGCAGSTLLIILAFALEHRAVKRRIAQPPGLDGERTVTISPEGVAETWPDGGRSVTWDQIRRPVIDSRQLYLRTDEGEILVPRRAFLGGGHLQAFVIQVSAFRHGMAAEHSETWPPKPR